MPSRTVPSLGKRSFIAAAALIVAVAVVVSCSTSDSRGPERPLAAKAPAAAPAQAASVSAPFDLGGVMKQVHFAYRPEGPGFIGGHRTYEVRASAEGFGVTPVSLDGAQAAPARFVTTSIGRDAPEAPAAGVARVEKDGHLAVARGPVTEHLRNDEDGVEHSLAFADRPEGRGDLVVRVRVSGEAYAGATEGGHHFVDPATGLGVRYGAATWVDARGERTALAVRWSEAEGELSIAVPDELVEGSAYPAVLDPTVSAEIGIDTPVPQATEGDQITPAVAFDGANYLVVWNDARLGSTYFVVGARVTSAGAILDAGGIFVSTVTNHTGYATKPAVAFDGTNFLVVWDDSYNGYIYGARVAKTGAVLDSSGFLIQGVGYAYTPVVAFDGANYLVVWDDDRGLNHEIYGNRVTTAGAALNGNGFAINNAANDQIAPALAFDGTNYLVVWQDRRGGFSYDVYGTRVSKAGTPLDGAGIQISAAANDQLAPAVAFDGSNYFVVWSDGRWGTPDIYGSRVSTLGVVLDPSGIGVSSMTANAQTTPSMAFDGTNYVVVWADTRAGNSDLYAARVTPAGALLDTTGFVITAGAPAAPEQAPAVTCTAAGACFAVWQDQRNGNWDVYGARFSGTSITDLQGIRISIAANDESTPSVAFNGTDYLVVWQDNRAVSSWDVYGARVSGAGVVLDTSGIAISTAANDQITPRVAWMAPSYLVVWEDKRSGGTNPGDIYGARVDATGAVLDAAGFVVSAAANEQKTPSVAADGTNFFVVWADGRAGCCTGYGARVSPAGAVLDAAGVSFTTNGITSPAVAFDGTRYLVVWSTGSIRGNRVTPAGAALDGATGFQISASGSAPNVAFDGLNFLTVFQNGSGVFGARVTGAAAVLDPTGLPISPGASGAAHDQPAVACDGATCLVTWRDYRTKVRHDIFGSFVDQSGTILNASGISISANTFEHAAPAVARDLAGHALVVYQRLDLVQPYGGLRVHARLVTSLGQGTTCTAPSDCASGFCVDGYCCNTACGGGAATDCFACSVAAGASANGSCTALNGIPCDDNNACTATDVCQAGTCVGSGTVTCTAMDSCHTAGVCNVGTGMCTNPVKADGTMCSDGNACTQTDTCTAGVCTGKNPVVCPTADQCHTVAACDPLTGMCAVTPKPDGTTCSDGNACTMGDTCQAGACVPGAAVVCPTPDQCHTAGTCSTTTGMCSNPAKPNGTGCDDGDKCTMTDTCQVGVCKSGAVVVCPGADQCNDASACDPATGTCSNGAKNDGTACEDGDLCTGPDTCQAGKCQVGAAVVCQAMDECHDVGKCFAGSGACSNPLKPNGTACTGGTCKSGNCVPSAGTSSSSSSSGSASGSGSGGGGAGGAGAGGEPSATSGGNETGTGGGTPGMKGGCGCRVAGEQEPAAGALPAMALALMAAARRRRARRGA
jgi:MYXO-CTERM domain-containing protein